MRLQVFFVRHCVAAGPELHHVHGIQRQSRQLGQASGERRFSAAGVPEYRDSFHMTRSIIAPFDASGVRPCRSGQRPMGIRCIQG